MIVFIILLILSIILILSTLKIKIVNCRINNFSKEIIKEIKIEISLCLLGKIKFLKFTIKQKKVEKLLRKLKFNLKDKLENVNFKKLINYKKSSNYRHINYFKELQIKIEKFYLKLDIGTENMFFTIFLVPVIATIIASFLASNTYKIDYNNFHYEINPLYESKNLYNINLDCIISAKIVNIIYIIYLLKISKKESDQVGNTSNRKFNANCNEQY